MKCILPNCKNDIPATRKRSSKYCSNECYYKAKKDRSINQYAILKAPAEELKRCERILSNFYQFALLKKEIKFEDLNSVGFNFTISSGEHLDKGRLFKIIGKYAYFIEENKNVIIWKSK